MKPMRISSVFTPRNSAVNLQMYVPRLRLEQALLDSVRGSMHSLLFGESGNGKSWLYKKVLEQNGIRYEVANCASASRRRSLTEEIRSVLLPDGTATKTGYSEKKEASANAVFAAGKLEHQSQYSLASKDPLLEAFERFGGKANSEVCVLVLDNLESIFKRTELMDELADILILSDDPRFAACRVKLLVVGVPNGVLDYFAQTKNLESVANRLEELPKVGSLSPSMVRTLVTRGLNNLLMYNFPGQQIEEIASHTHHVTMGVAQRVHEYCGKFASAFEMASKKYSKEIMKRADHDWLIVGLRQCYTVVESHLNSKRTTIARRNQVIYCVGHMKLHQFDSNDVRDAILEIFPKTVSDASMGIGTILTELTTGENPLLSRNPRTSEYRVADPRYLMCIRIALWVDPASQNVSKGNFAI